MVQPESAFANFRGRSESKSEHLLGTGGAAGAEGEAAGVAGAGGPSSGFLCPPDVIVRNRS